MRLGEAYRIESLRARGIGIEGERILDVGCHDGALLSSLGGRVRVGVDLAPQRSRGSMWLVQADGRCLPFRRGYFDQIVALDVLEHVQDDARLAGELVRVGRMGAQILITTPALTIRMFPPFLTDWISARWGHRWRRGYSMQGLVELMGGRCRCTVEPWSGGAYRLAYLFLRLLAAAWPALALRIVRWLALYDARHSEGHHGFYWLRCQVVTEE